MLLNKWKIKYGLDSSVNQDKHHHYMNKSLTVSIECLRQYTTHHVSFVDMSDVITCDLFNET